MVMRKAEPSFGLSSVVRLKQRPREHKQDHYLNHPEYFT